MMGYLEFFFQSIGHFIGLIIILSFILAALSIVFSGFNDFLLTLKGKPTNNGEDT